VPFYQAERSPAVKGGTTSEASGRRPWRGTSGAKFSLEVGWKVPLGSPPFYRELLSACGTAVGLCRWELLLELSICGWSERSEAERTEAEGGAGGRSGAKRSGVPPAPPSMSFPVLSCFCSLFSPCLLVGSSSAGMLLYRAGVPCRPFPCWPGWGALPLGRAGGDKEVVPAGRNREVWGELTFQNH